MQLVLPKLIIVLSLQRVGCWASSGPTAPPSSDNPMVPAPTQAPLRRADFDLQGHSSPPCAQLSGDASVSDYIFNCPAGQTCGILYQEGTYWGCCKVLLDIHLDTGCDGTRLYCPMYSTCIDSTALGSCDSDCMTDPRVLKCSGSTKPFCAIGSASISKSAGQIYRQYACANYPYTLHYTVFSDYLYEPLTHPTCAPPWIDSPSKFGELSKSAEMQTSTATIQDFANPFDQVVARANFSVSTVLPFATVTTTSVPSVRIPTAPPATSTTTTSTGVRWVVSPRNSLYILYLFYAGLFLLS